LTDLTDHPAANAPRNKSWRDFLPVHAAADLFPLMSEAELRELGKDIKKNGLRSPIILWSPGDQLDKSAKVYLLDGRNRLDAMELVGMETIDKDGKLSKLLGGSSRLRGIRCDPVRHLHEISVAHAMGDWEEKKPIRKPDIDPYTFVLSANMHRLHLTADQKRDVIAKLLRAKPEISDRAIAKQTKVDHKTVGKARAELEGRGEIPHVEKRTDAKGRKQPSAKPKAKLNGKDIDVSKLGPKTQAAIASQTGEVDIETRKAQMAELDKLDTQSGPMPDEASVEARANSIAPSGAVSIWRALHAAIEAIQTELNWPELSPAKRQLRDAAIDDLRSACSTLMDLAATHPTRAAA
jgi:hypothetical protein